MRRYAVSVAITMALLGVLPLSSIAKSGSVGQVSATGPVLVDGQPASGSVSVGGTARVATGDGASAVVALSTGGDLRLAAQSDVIVSNSDGRVMVHVLCGEVLASSTAPVTVLSANGGRAVVETGDATVLVAGGKNESLKSGKSRDFSGNVTLTAGGAGSALRVTSGRKCDCGCGSAFGGRP